MAPSNPQLTSVTKALVNAISRNSGLLMLISLITTALIASTYLGTRERIEEQKLLLRFKALREIVPNIQPGTHLNNHTISLQHPLLGYKDEKLAYQIVEHGQVNATVFTVVAPDGYTGAIELLMGVKPNGVLHGMRVISHRETPGLGDKIELRKSQWIEGFRGKSLDNPAEPLWDVKRHGGEFDQFTGATITPRAVVTAARNALKYTAQNHARLFNLQNHD